MGLKFKPDSSGLDPVIHGFVLVRFTGRKAVDTRIKSGQDERAAAGALNVSIFTMAKNKSNWTHTLN